MKTSIFIIFSIVILILTLLICLYFLQPKKEEFNVVTIGEQDRIINAQSINALANAIVIYSQMISQQLPTITKNVINDLSNNVIKSITITSNRPNDPPTKMGDLKLTLNNVPLNGNMNNIITSIIPLNQLLMMARRIDDMINDSIKNIKSINIQTK
jgi:hypothetical protein